MPTQISVGTRLRVNRDRLMCAGVYAGDIVIVTSSEHYSGAFSARCERDSRSWGFNTSCVDAGSLTTVDGSHPAIQPPVRGRKVKPLPLP